MQQSRVYVGMILILIFGEVLGLYGYAIHTPSPRYSDAVHVANRKQSDRRVDPELEELKGP